MAKRDTVGKVKDAQCVSPLRQVGTTGAFHMNQGQGQQRFQQKMVRSSIAHPYS